MARRLLYLQKHYCTVNNHRYSYYFLILNQLSTVLCSNRTPCTLEDVYSRTSQTEQFLSLHTRRVEYHKVSTYYSSPDSGSVFTIKSVYVLISNFYPLMIFGLKLHGQGSCLLPIHNYSLVESKNILDNSTLESRPS